jgi:hypothetical protein
VRSDGFENVLNGDVAALEPSRGNRAAVEHETGDIETRQRHHGRRNRLVAADEHDQRVEEVAARDQLDRVRDHLAADERRAHALAAHRDAVGDGDRVELERRAAGRAYAFLDVTGQFTQVEIAGADLDPGVRDPDDRFLKVVVLEPRGAQHRARRSPAGAIRERAAAPFERTGVHEAILSPRASHK